MRMRKAKPPVRVRERVAKKGGRCAGCRLRFEPGSDVTDVITRRRRYHRGCTPANATAVPTTSGGPAIGSAPLDVVSAMRSNWTVNEAKLVAIQAIENAMVVIAKNKAIVEQGVDPNKAFDKYKKFKTVFLRGGSDNESRMGAKQAVLEVIKTFF